MTAAIETRIEGLIAIEPPAFGDDRGFLIESFSIDRWREFGVDEVFVQENHSRSTQRGTLRGMHFQTEPGQGKLVRCPRGAIFDVAVDLRRGSPTFGEWEAFELDDERLRLLYVPVGFDEGIERTVAWYRDNSAWWEPIRSGEYREYYERQYGTKLGGE